MMGEMHKNMYRVTRENLHISKENKQITQREAYGIQSRLNNSRERLTESEVSFILINGD